MRRLVLLLGVVALAFAAGLVIRLPAERAVTWFAPQGVQLQGVHGTAWAGGAARVDHGGAIPVRGLEWDLAAWRLVTGRAVADVELEWAGLDGRGRLARGLGGGLSADDVLVRGPVAGVAGALGGLDGFGLRLEGEMIGRVERAALSGGRIEDLAGRLQWSDAAIAGPLQLALGQVRVEIADADGRPGQQITVTGNGGALDIDGDIDLRPDGQYRADIELRPTDRAPEGLRETLGMFAQSSGDGFRIRRSGRVTLPGGGT